MSTAQAQKSLLSIRIKLQEWMMRYGNQDQQAITTSADMLLLSLSEKLEKESLIK